MSPEKLQKYDVVWDEPSQDSSGSMPLGNGEIGINAWVEQNGDLLFYIARTDAWSENGRLLKIGRLRVTLDPNPFRTGEPFRQTLKLRDGEIEIRAGASGGEKVLRLWVDANAPAIHLEASGEDDFELRATVEIWRDTAREITGAEAASAYGMHGGPRPIIESGDVLVDEKGERNRLVWYHRNPTSIWPFTNEHQGLAALVDAAEEPLLNRTFGAVVQGDGLVNESASVLKSVAPGRAFTLTVYPHTAQTASVEEWLAGAEEQIAVGAATSVETARTSHRHWWNAFWERSWIDVHGDEAETVTRGYVLQRFISACAGRGAFPIKFNGSLFTVDAREEGETYDPDYRRWGGPYWFQNTRLTYWPMLPAGDYEMMLPLFEMYRRALPLAKARTRLYFGHEGAFFPETMYFWGAYANTNYGWDRDGKHVSHIDNTYIRWYWSGALELCLLMLDYAAHTGDKEFIAKTLLPMATSVLDFYDQHYGRDEDGKLFISPAQSLEMWQDADNPLPEIAGLRTVLDGLLALEHEPGEGAESTSDETSVGGVSAERLAQWRRLRNEVPEIPLREEDGQTLIAAAERKTDVAMNVENPELYAVFPYRNFAVGKPELEMARATYLARGIQTNQGWNQDVIQAAYLGLTDEARRQLVERFSTRHTGSRFPAFWGPNYDWIPDQDHGGGACIALQSMLMQAEGKTIHLFPAWPKEWNVEFKLHAPHGTIVSGVYADGELTKLDVQPAERKNDVVICLGEVVSIV